VRQTTGHESFHRHACLWDCFSLALAGRTILINHVFAHLAFRNPHFLFAAVVLIIHQKPFLGFLMCSAIASRCCNKRFLVGSGTFWLASGGVAGWWSERKLQYASPVCPNHPFECKIYIDNGFRNRWPVYLGLGPLAVFHHRFASIDYLAEKQELVTRIVEKVRRRDQEEATDRAQNAPKYQRLPDPPTPMSAWLVKMFIELIVLPPFKLLAIPAEFVWQQTPIPFYQQSKRVAEDGIAWTYRSAQIDASRRAEIEEYNKSQEQKNAWPRIALYRAYDGGYVSRFYWLGEWEDVKKKTQEFNPLRVISYTWPPEEVWKTNSDDGFYYHNGEWKRIVLLDSNGTLLPD
jgi:hypothetical protein